MRFQPTALALATVVAAGLTTAVASAEMAVSTTQLQNSPTQYDRQAISVTGTIRESREDGALRLCNGPCVRIIGGEYLQRHLNERMTVYGRYVASRNAVRVR